MRLKMKMSFNIPSFSNKVISYKGLVMPTHIKTLFLDLSDEDFKTTFALFHQRFSTNTLPKWKLAQPFRAIAHNGEINSIAANRFFARMKGESAKSNVFSDKELEKLLPITNSNMSDSASLDNMFEFMIVNGFDFFKAARVSHPSSMAKFTAYGFRIKEHFMSMQVSILSLGMGPAAISLTDGRHIGCVLDRNGLRPAKYVITKDDRIIISSEYGVIDIEEENIQERGRLQSGQMIGIDLKFGKVMKSHEIDDYIKSSNRYADWLNKNLVLSSRVC